MLTIKHFIECFMVGVANLSGKGPEMAYLRARAKEMLYGLMITSPFWISVIIVALLIALALGWSPW